MIPVQTLPTPSSEVHGEYFRSPRSPGGGFANPWGVRVDKSPLDILRWKTGDNEYAALKRQPPRLPRVEDPLGGWARAPAGARLMWLGHASWLVELDGLHALIDPLFGRAALVPRAAPAPLTVDQLPPIDVLLLTHGHYDHFDAPSLRALARRFGPDLPVVLPEGLGRNLPAGLRAVELSWWQAVELRGVQLALVPAQHWHRRGAFDQDRALWGGVVLRGSRTVYHSGDTGWFGGFSAIGEVFPAIDAAILPLGAFAPRWMMKDQHMDPAESVVAWRALGARMLVGMHWGTFDLTDEPLDYGAFEVLPEAVARAGADPEGAVVLAHGGVLVPGPRPEVHGAAEVPGLAR